MTGSVVQGFANYLSLSKDWQEQLTKMVGARIHLAMMNEEEGKPAATVTVFRRA
jgi:hypothetical protein